MAKVAAAGPLPSSNGLHATTTTMKRKTPLELRGEQLKRKNVVELVDESTAPAVVSVRNSNGVGSGPKKLDLSKNPRYIDTRMDELFPVRKNSIRLRLLSKKDDVKAYSPVDQTGSLRSSSVCSELNTENQPEKLRVEHSLPSSRVSKDQANQAYKTSETCIESTFRSVTDLSLGSEKLSGLSTADLDKALKGLDVYEPIIPPPSLADFPERTSMSTLGSFCSEFQIQGKKSPLDLTLKTTMRVTSSSSVNWFHRLVNSGISNFMAQSTSLVGCSWSPDTSSERTSNTQVWNQRSFCSWVHPLSPLPTAVISALRLSTGDGGQIDFLSKRQQVWEDSFRSLYYMLRQGICNIFYVCTAQFVVMFINDGPKGTKQTCKAYISQSMGGLRSLLKEHDICFSMPLCHSKVEEVTTEDLVELSEIEKRNLGQTRRMSTLSDMDNSPESLLVFTGKNVHGLYDILLNYRYFLTSLSGMDVPVLYSPIPFENAACSVPEVRCKEVRRADQLSLPLKDTTIVGEPNQVASAGICYSIEIKDAYLPPWIICSVFDAMGSKETSFEASFATVPMSIGLNVGLNIFNNLSVPLAMAEKEVSAESSNLLGITNTTFSPHLCSGFLNGVKYTSGSYTAFLSPI